MFKIVLMLEAMGMYVLINHNRTPTTTSTMTIVINGMLFLFCNSMGAVPCPQPLGGRLTDVSRELVSQ